MRRLGIGCGEVILQCGVAAQEHDTRHVSKFWREFRKEGKIEDQRMEETLLPGPELGSLSWSWSMMEILTSSQRGLLRVDLKPRGWSMHFLLPEIWESACTYVEVALCCDYWPVFLSVLSLVL
jgi:hypothetical protein